MKRPLYSRRNIVAGIGLAILACMVGESCSSAKACGCKGDLNSVYRPKKRYR